MTLEPQDDPLLSADYANYQCLQARDLKWRDIPLEYWTGQTDGGVFLWSEQGPGDQLLFLSMLPDFLAKTRGTCVLELDKRLVALVASSFENWPIVLAGSGEGLAMAKVLGLKYHCPLGGIGKVLRPSSLSFKTQPLGYIKSGLPLVPLFRSSLRVGISWTSTRANLGQHKSCPIMNWEPLFDEFGPKTSFINLQYGEEGTRCPPSLYTFPGIDLTNNFTGVAGIIEHLDLVVTVSNTVAHLAAAIGKPTWVMTSPMAGTFWYWGRLAETTPWYPSVKLIRQQEPGNWSKVMERVAEGMRELVTAGTL